MLLQYKTTTKGVQIDISAKKKKGSESKGRSILENSSWSHYLQSCFNLWMPAAGVGVRVGAISLGPADPEALTDKDKSEQELPANWRLGRLSPGLYEFG